VPLPPTACTTGSMLDVGDSRSGSDKLKTGGMPGGAAALSGGGTGGAALNAGTVILGEIAVVTVVTMTPVSGGGMSRVKGVVMVSCVVAGVAVAVARLELVECVVGDAATQTVPLAVSPGRSHTTLAVGVGLGSAQPSFPQGGRSAA